MHDGDGVLGALVEVEALDDAELEVGAILGDAGELQHLVLHLGGNAGVLVDLHALQGVLQEGVEGHGWP